MDHLETWKDLCDKLQDQPDSDSLKKLSKLFQHLSPQVAPRLMKEYESNTLKTHLLFQQLFDKIDLSDKKFLNSFLKTVKAFGFFRIAQITYHVYRPRENFEADPVYCPEISKAKWYNLSPLLPEAGEISWKALMGHGIVRDSDNDLLQTCLQLLAQKLHFYSIIVNLDHYSEFSQIIDRNGRAVAEKLFELIRDVAYDDQGVIGLDKFLFNLLLPFIDEEKLTTIVDATVQELSKSFTLELPTKLTDKLYDLACDYFMNDAKTQDIFVERLLDQLKCNAIRQKRRHSLDESLGNGSINWTTLMSDASVSFIQANDLKLPSKYIQTTFIKFWLELVLRLFSQRILTPNNATKILRTSLILLVLAIKHERADLIDLTCTLLTRTMNNNGQPKLEKFFNSCDPTSLSGLINLLVAGDEDGEMDLFGSPLEKVIHVYIDRYVQWTFLKYQSTEKRKAYIEKFQEFIEYARNDIPNKEVASFIQCTIIRSIANNVEFFKKKGMTNESVEAFLNCAKSCSKKAHKFIKARVRPRIITGEGDEDEAQDPLESDLVANGDTGKISFAIGTLVSIIKLAVESKDQKFLDKFIELLLRLFDVLNKRLDNIKSMILLDTPKLSSPIDSHLSSLVKLYIEDNGMIKPYHQTLMDDISSILILNEKKETDGQASNVKDDKYNEIKSSLDLLTERTQKSELVTQNIINSQYNLVVDPSTGSHGDIKKEKWCCRHIESYLNIVKEVLDAIFKQESLTTTTSNANLESIVSSLEVCDATNHRKFLYLLLSLECFANSTFSSSKDDKRRNSMNEFLPRISWSLLRISKSIELGPSVRASRHSGGHRSNIGILCCTYTNSIKLYTLIFKRFPPNLTNSFITDAMQISVNSNLMLYARNSSKLRKFYTQLASATIQLLQSICIGRKDEDVLRSSMPIFLTMLSDLIRSLVVASDRSKFCTDDDPNESIQSDTCDFDTSLECLSIDVARALNNMSFLRVKLVDYAPHLISSYVSDIQRASCPEHVKTYLDEGIFRIFNLVDAHQKERQQNIMQEGVQRKTIAGKARGSLFDMIHARLNQASREIFQDMYENYNKFHRYLGKC